MFSESNLATDLGYLGSADDEINQTWNAIANLKVARAKVSS